VKKFPILFLALLFGKRMQAQEVKTSAVDKVQKVCLILNIKEISLARAIFISIGATTIHGMVKVTSDLPDRIMILNFTMW